MPLKTKIKTYQHLYMTALAFVGVVAALFFYLNSKAIKKNQVYASVINISGKQRMLSQRSVLIAANTKKEEYLNSLLNEMQLSQKKLDCNNIEIPCDHFLNKKIEASLERHIDILQNSSKESINTYIEDELSFFLHILNQRVVNFEIQAKAHAEKIIFTEQIIVAFLIAILFLEAVFIFRPILNGMYVQILAAKSSEKVAKSALQQNEKLLGSISHYFKTPLNQMLFEIKKLEEKDSVNLMNSFEHLQSSLKHILDFYKTDEDRIYKLANSDLIFNKLPENTKTHLESFEAKTLKVDADSLAELMTASVDLANELEVELKMELNSILQLSFRGSTEKLLNIESTSQDSVVYSSLAFSRWLKELYRFAYEISVSGTELIYKVKLEECEIPQKEEKSKIKKALIVDDQAINLKILGIKLKKLGIDYISASNGLEAIEKCSKEIDLIFLDIKMPVMDGFDAAKELKKQYPDIPIVFVSANDFPRDIINAIESGGASFIGKPVGNADLEDEISFFEKYEKQVRISWDKKNQADA